MFTEKALEECFQRSGALTEKEAAEFLRGRGYRIIHCNVRICSVQIDLLVRSPDGTRTLVEVKSTGAHLFGYLSKKQKQRLQRVQAVLSSEEPTELLLLVKDLKRGFLEIPIED